MLRRLERRLRGVSALAPLGVSSPTGVAPATAAARRGVERRGLCADGEGVARSAARRRRDGVPCGGGRASSGGAVAVECCAAVVGCGALTTAVSSIVAPSIDSRPAIAALLAVSSAPSNAALTNVAAPPRRLAAARESSGDSATDARGAVGAAAPAPLGCCVENEMTPIVTRRCCSSACGRDPAVPAIARRAARESGAGERLSPRAS